MLGRAKFISTREAAEILGLSESTVYNRKGGTAKLSRIKQGRAVRLIRQEVEAYRDKLISSHGQRRYFPPTVTQRTEDETAATLRLIVAQNQKIINLLEKLARVWVTDNL